MDWQYVSGIRFASCGNGGKAMSTSIGKEIAFRRHSSPYKDPKHPKVLYKAAEDMTLEERSRLKGDTLDLDLLTRQNIGSNLSEVIVQFDQDGFIKKGNIYFFPSWIVFSLKK